MGPVAENGLSHKLAEQAIASADSVAHLANKITEPVRKGLQMSLEKLTVANSSRITFARIGNPLQISRRRFHECGPRTPKRSAKIRSECEPMKWSRMW
jgi:hypothetical protein